METLDARLGRVERVLDRSLLDQLQRIDALQAELSELRGELERLSYELESERRRNADLYGDTDARLLELEETLEEVVPSGGLLDETVLGGEGDAQGTAQEEGSGAPAVIVPEGGRREVVPPVAGFGDGPTPTAGRTRDTATQAEKTAYTDAYDLLARGQNEAAVDAFEAFLTEYPDGPYSDNAWYWQGEALYAQRRFDEARRNFEAVVDAFPQSTKVPDARLKIGYSLYEQGAFEEARDILTEVRDAYPGRSASVLARKRLQQMDREGR